MSETEQGASEGPVEAAASAVAKRVTKVSVSDPELVAMHKVQEVLNGLEPGQALRVLEWNKQKALGPDIARLTARVAACQEAMAQEPALVGKYQRPGAVPVAAAAAPMPEFG